MAVSEQKTSRRVCISTMGAYPVPLSITTTGRCVILLALESESRNPQGIVRLLVYRRGANATG